MFPVTLPILSSSQVFYIMPRSWNLSDVFSWLGCVWSIWRWRPVRSSDPSMWHIVGDNFDHLTDLFFLRFLHLHCYCFPFFPTLYPSGRSEGPLPPWDCWHGSFVYSLPFIHWFYHLYCFKLWVLIYSYFILLLKLLQFCHWVERSPCQCGFVFSAPSLFDPNLLCYYFAVRIPRQEMYVSHRSRSPAFLSS